MKTQEEIDELYHKLYDISLDGEDTLHYYSFVEGYTQCQNDTKQILLDFIKWSNAVDEYGNKLDNVDIDNFLNKQD